MDIEDLAMLEVLLIEYTPGRRGCLRRGVRVCRAMGCVGVGHEDEPTMRNHVDRGAFGLRLR